MPADPAITTVLAPIAGRYDFVLGDSETYSPSGLPHLNGLRMLEAGRGYMIRMKEEATLTVSGSRLSPSTPIHLSRRWQWIGYLGESPASPSEALESIDGKYVCVVGESGSHCPGRSFAANSLRLMEPGKGYMINVTEEVDLTYEP